MYMHNVRYISDEHSSCSNPKADTYTPYTESLSLLSILFFINTLQFAPSISSTTEFVTNKDASK